MTTMTELAGAEPAPIPALPLTSRLSGLEPLVIRDMLLEVITTNMAAHPRSLQRRIGPSEMGTPCTRKLTYKLAGVTGAERAPSWLPQIGTGVHAMLAEFFVNANMANWSDPSGSALPTGAADSLAVLGPMTVLDSSAGSGVREFVPPVLRYAVECTVDVGEVNGVHITGSCDLFDRVTSTVVDWKVVGPTTLRKAKATGPSGTYRSQAHLYGRGWTRRGVPVERVAIMFLPRNGELTDAVFWSEPYEEQVALDALARADAVAKALDVVGTEAMLAASPVADDYCRSCEFRRPGAATLTEGCPGVTPAATRPPASATEFLMGRS